ncbi:MAG: hypothetical protein GQ574_02640 [Crocinitomix sp.]|nr:hypothetical protein [Crocinitomix sp.]
MSTKQDRIPLKTYFETGDRPTELQFIELIDSILVQTEDDIHGKKDDNGVPNIGIGTPDPKRKLHVAGKTFISDSSTTQPRAGHGNALEVNAVGTNGIAIVTNKNDVLNFIDDGDPMNEVPFTITDNSGRGFRFYENVKDGTNNGEKMSIIPNGNVGINMGWQQKPVSKLEVRGDSEDEGKEGILKVEGPNSNADANLRFGVVNGSHSWIQAHGSKPLHINGVGNHTIINKSGGNVGIGTTSTTEKLTVDGNISLTGHIYGDKSNKPAAHDTLNISNGATIQLFGEGHDNAPGRVVIGARKDPNNDKSGAILFSKVKTTGGWENNMIIDHAGNIGVGTTNPTNRLHVQSLTTDTDHTGLTLSGQTGVSPGDILSTDGSGKAKWVPATTVTNGLWKKVGTTGHIESGNGGNVGIGTNDPKSKLHVNGDIIGNNLSGNTSLFLHATSSVNNEGASIGLYQMASGNSGGIDFNAQGTLNNQQFRFINRGPSSNPSKISMVINGDGKVGIGLESPKAKFDINGAYDQEGSQGLLKLGGNKVDDAATLRFGVNDSPTKYTWIQSHGGVPLKLNPHSAGNHTSINEGGGNVTIGSSSRNANLHVNGNVNFSGNVKINNEFPFFLKRFTPYMKDMSVGSTNNKGNALNTGVSTTNYGAALITGFCAYDGYTKNYLDKNQYVSVFQYGGTWRVAADVKSEAPTNAFKHEKWYVDVMFIRAGIVELDSNSNWSLPLNLL